MAKIKTNLSQLIELFLIEHPNRTYVCEYVRHFARWAKDKIQIEMCIKESDEDCKNCFICE